MHKTTDSDTKRIVLDACSLINLVNGNILQDVLALPLHFYCIGSIVLSESESVKGILTTHIGSGRLTLIEANEISALQFLQLSQQYRLGRGETECIAYATGSDSLVCTDDGKARDAVRACLGKDRLSGTIALMQLCINQDLMNCTEANKAFALMLSAGAYLPKHTF